jgi:hypothetical protein
MRRPQHIDLCVGTGLSPSSVIRILASDPIAHTREGRCKYYDPEAAAAWIERHRKIVR